jgi:hypothetical protein
MRFNKIHCFLPLLFIIVACTSCDEIDPPVSINRSVKNYNAIVIETSVLVYVYQANYNFVRLEGDEYDIKNITTETNDKKLYISNDKTSHFESDTESLVVVQCKELYSIENNLAGHLLSKMPLELTDLKIINSRNGKIEISGNANKLDINNLSVGKIDLGNLKAQTVNVKLEGSGSVWIDTSLMLNATILGSGNVYYKGNPEIIKTGSGQGKCIKFDK